MFDLFSTNNAWGWLCFFAAHLIRNCGISEREVEMSIIHESMRAEEYNFAKTHLDCNHPEWRSRYMSDSQCIMITNGWFYYFDKASEVWTCHALPGTHLEPEAFAEGLDYWLARA